MKVVGTLTKNGVDAFAAGGSGSAPILGSASVYGRLLAGSGDGTSIPIQNLTAYLNPYTFTTGAPSGSSTPGVVPFFEEDIGRFAFDYFFCADGTWRIPASQVPLKSVTFGHIQDITTGKLLGRASTGTGSVEEITLGTGLSLTGTTLNATGGGGSSDPLVLATELVADAAVSTPTTGIKIWASNKANRRQPAYITSTGQTERLQTFLGSNDVKIVDVVAGVTGYQMLGTTMATDLGTAGTPIISTTNYLTMQPRRTLSIATANGIIESKAAQQWCSRRSVGGGFHFTARFGMETLFPTATQSRFFAGYTGATTAIAAAEPSTIPNAIAIAKNAADTTIRLMLTNATPAAQFVTLTNCGAAGWNNAGVMYQLEINCSIGDIGFGWRLTRTNADGTRVFDDGYVTSGNMPAIDTLFAPHIWASPVAAATITIAVMSLYCETD